MEILEVGIMAVIVTILSLVIHLFLHEVGHMIGGLLSGYQFMFIRFGSYTLLNDHGKFKFTKFNIPGTAGQCIMKPPVSDKFKFKLYFAGGVIMNILLSAIGILLFLFSSHDVLDIFGIELVYMGLVFGLMNGLPLKISGIVNDGFHIFRIKKEEIPKLYQQLMIGCLDIEGYTFTQMDDSLFQCDIHNTSNFYDSYLISMNAFRYIETEKYEEAKVLFQSLIEDDKGLDLFKVSAKMMMILLEFIDKGLDGEIEFSNDKKLLKSVKQQKFDLASLLTYYCILLKENDSLSENIKHQFLKQCELVIEKGEVPLFKNLYQKIEEKIK